MATVSRAIIFLPLLLFSFSLIIESYAAQFKIPGGVLTTLVELFMTFMIAIEIKSAVFTQKKLAVTGAILICAGDAAYGFLNYGLNFAAVNQIGCLTYVIPYMAAMCIIIYLLGLAVVKQSRDDKLVVPIVTALSLIFIMVTLITITVPALFYKVPALSPFLAILTVIYSILEPLVIALTVFMLICATEQVDQIGLFGVLSMHISDLAIRYQSVRTETLGMSVFESGWCLGISLVYMALLLKKTNVKNNRTTTHTPFYSLRGVTVGLVFFSLVVMWIFFLKIYHVEFTAPHVSSGLLIIFGIFSISIVVANIITEKLEGLTNEIRASSKTISSPGNLPYEIKTLVERFNQLIADTEHEKTKTMKLTAQVVHDLRNPTSALKVIPQALVSATEKCKSCSENIVEPLRAVTLATETVQRIANDLLKRRKQGRDFNNVKSAINNAVYLTKQSYPENNIEVQFSTGGNGPIVEGLERVLANLLKNAVEASPSNKKVLVSLTESANNYILKVADSGNGIPKNILEKVYHGDEVLSTKVDGNGLGLSGMVDWTKKNNVSYQINSAEGLGTEILLIIKNIGDVYV